MTKEHEITINKNIMIKVLSQYLCERFIIKKEDIISTKIEYNDTFKLVFTEPEPELNTEKPTEYFSEVPFEDLPHE